MEENFKIDSKDDEILETFDLWLKEAESYHDAILPFQKKSEQYYLGNQTDRDLIPAYNSNVVENRIFEGVETIVPVATANAHQFVVLPGTESETSVRKAELVQKVLTKKYQTLEMQRKLEEIARHLCLYRFGVAKYWWDEYLDDINVSVIDPRLIMIPKMRVDPHRLPYVIEIQEYTRSEMEEFFPKVDLDELTTFDPDKTGSKANLKIPIYRVYETWTDEMTAWISAGEKKVLDKTANPYWDFEGSEKKLYETDTITGKRKVRKELVYHNHLDRPEKSYVFFTTFNVSDGPIPETSLVEITIPIQDSINVRKRKIIDNLRTLGNGAVLVDSDAMSQEEADNITDEPGIVIRGENVASLQKVRREQGVPLPQAHFSDLQHSEAVFDNIMGVHSATRGSAAAKTLGQDILSRQQDFTRIDLITRVLNRGVARLANGLVQLMKMFYTETKTVKILGEDGSLEFVRLNRNDIEDYIEIDVKSGNMLPMDEVSLRSEAVQLWQLGAISPRILFERLKFPNPEQAEQDLILWKQGQLSMETQAHIAEAQASAQAGAQAKAQTGGGGEPGQGRGVESPLNVLQRARSQLGGTAPVAPGTPKL